MKFFIMRSVINHYAKQTMSQQITNEESLKVDRDVLAQISKAIQSIRFGSVEIIIQDGKVVQIERKEKIRFIPDTKKGQG